MIKENWSASSSKYNRRNPFASDPQIEDIKSIMVSDDIVKPLGLDALRYIDVLMEQPLGFTQRIADCLS